MGNVFKIRMIKMCSRVSVFKIRVVELGGGGGGGGGWGHFGNGLWS